MYTLKKFGDFKGRASVQEFWYFVLFLMLGQFLAGTLFYFLGPIAGLVSALMFVPSLAVTVRRLHDVNRSGKDLLMLGLLLFAGPLFGFFGRMFLGRLILLGIAGLALVGFANLLLLLTKKGGTVPNKYGAAPSAFSFAEAPPLRPWPTKSGRSTDRRVPAGAPVRFRY